MHGSGIQIWFFIGVLLLIYGALIFGYGVVEWTSGIYPKGVELAQQLHTPVWWGGLLGALGLFYVIKFRPSRNK